MAKREKWVDPLTKAERAKYNDLFSKGTRGGGICMGTLYFTSEAEADEFGALSAKAGNTYNGGYHHGMSCGRESGRDYTDKDGVRWYGTTY